MSTPTPAATPPTTMEIKKEIKDTRRRVKVYVLNDKRSWEDRGTGHVSCLYNEKFQSLALTVRSEADGSVTLESKIQADTAYQKQQETLIVWSEGENCDLALSFQEKLGCEEIWEKICQFQGKDPSVEVTQDTGYEGESDGGSPENNQPVGSAGPAGTNWQLPLCELSRLIEINDLLTSCFSTSAKRESLANAIEAQGYIKKLLELFKVCEDLDNHDSLQLLYRIFKNIFMLNKNALFEILFSEDNLRDVVGVFEYEPNGTTPRNHRDYLWEKAKFKEVIPIASGELKAKIHQTYRVQYIQDFILPAPSIFEENLLSTLSSFIFFNKVEIVSLIQDDETFLGELFSQLTSPTATIERKRDLAMFLKEFCSFSQTLQPQARENFFKGLTAHGILPAMENCLKSTDEQSRLAVVDILSHVVDYNASLVREYALQESKTRQSEQLKGKPLANCKETLLNVIIEEMFHDEDPEIGAAIQLAGICKILIDPENMMSTTIPKSDKGEFLSFFYKQCMSTLVGPLFECTSDEKPIKDDYHTAHLLSLVLDLLSFCIEHHLFQMRTYAINKNILKRILVLLKSRHSFLALGALRLFRRIVQLKDEMYNRHIVRERLFEAICECYRRNGHRYNLMNSAILELFEFIRTEDLSTLVTDICEHFIHYFKDVNYVKTFDALKLRHEQHLERLRNKLVYDERSPTPPPPHWRRERDQREADEEEDQWFNEVEDDWQDDDLPANVSIVSKPSEINQIVTSVLPGKSSVLITANSIMGLKRNTSSPGGTSTQSTVAAASSTTCEDDLPAVLRKEEPESINVVCKPLLNRSSKITIKPISTSVVVTTSPSPDVSLTPLSPAAPISPNMAARKSLVDYDFDDSDEEDENQGSSEAQATCGSIPSEPVVDSSSSTKPKPVVVDSSIEDTTEHVVGSSSIETTMEVVVGSSNEEAADQVVDSSSEDPAEPEPKRIRLALEDSS